MDLSSVNQYFGNLDLYLLDQILKKRFHPGMKVLDAGCGEGRNLMYFLNAGYNVFGIDNDPAAIEAVRFIAASIRPDLDRRNFQVGDLADLPCPDRSFDLIISCGVLHDAENERHFYAMFDELVRCITPGGLLFVSMASNIGNEKLTTVLGSGKYLLPDGGEYFLLTRELLDKLTQRYALNCIEPVKTVNIENSRGLSILVVSISG